MIIYVKNINNSMAFYRQLFNKMPDKIGHDRLWFELESGPLMLYESTHISRFEGFHSYMLSTFSAFTDAYLRTKRFSNGWALSTKCETLKNQFTIKDPDGHNWIVSFGKPDHSDLIEGTCFNQSIN